jgi:hypothetical protein
MRITNAYLVRVLRAAEADPVVADHFSRVIGMIDPPAGLLHPVLVLRIAKAGLPPAQQRSIHSPTLRRRRSSVVNHQRANISGSAPRNTPWQAVRKVSRDRGPPLGSHGTNQIFTHPGHKSGPIALHKPATGCRQRRNHLVRMRATH